MQLSSVELQPPNTKQNNDNIRATYLARHAARKTAEEEPCAVGSWRHLARAASTLSRNDLNRWGATHDALLKFVAENNGDFPRHRPTDGDEKRLAAWVHNQRQMHRSKKSDNCKLTASRMKRLTEIPGWQWSAHLKAGTHHKTSRREISASSSLFEGPPGWAAFVSENSGLLSDGCKSGNGADPRPTSFTQEEAALLVDLQLGGATASKKLNTTVDPRQPPRDTATPYAIPWRGMLRVKPTLSYSSTQTPILDDKLQAWCVRAAVFCDVLCSLMKHIQILAR